MAIVKDGYILSRIKRKELKKGFLKDVRRFYKVDNAVKVWIDWVIRIRKFVEIKRYIYFSTSKSI